MRVCVEGGTERQEKYLFEQAIIQNKTMGGGSHRAVVLRGNILHIVQDISDRIIVEGRVGGEEMYIWIDEIPITLWGLCVPLALAFLLYIVNIVHIADTSHRQHIHTDNTHSDIQDCNIHSHTNTKHCKYS